MGGGGGMRERKWQDRVRAGVEGGGGGGGGNEMFPRVSVCVCGVCGGGWCVWSAENE